MPFPEKIKLEAKRNSHFQCCICKQPFVEVHHIKPQKDGGPDTIDNAAPLCGGCHDLYGGNPEKQKQIREMRDLWWEVCETRYQDPDTCQLNEKLDSVLELLRTSPESTEDAAEKMQSAYLEFHKSKAEQIQSSSSLSELTKAVGITSPLREITICPICSNPTHPTGPRPSEYGLIMWYRCEGCGESFPGHEEWDG